MSDAFRSYGGSERRGQETRSAEYVARRERIINAAASVFREKGYANGSLDDVAAALGIRKPSLYHYINSKQELLQLVFHHALNEGLKQIRTLAEIEDPAARLAALIRFQVKLVAGDLEHFTVFFDHLPNATVKSELIAQGKTAEQVHELQREYLATFVATVRAAVEGGAIAAVDPKYGAQAIMGMTSWVYKWFDPERHDAEIVADTCIRLLLSGRQKEDLNLGVLLSEVQ